MYKLNDVQMKIFLDRYALKDDKGNAIEKTVEEMWKRVSKAIASVEKDKKKWEQEFYSVLEDFKFVPGGRISAGAGIGKDVTLFNCYVIPIKEDSRKGIMDTITEMVFLTSKGGGVGINWSILRPQGSYVKGVNGLSSGSISWMQACDSVSNQVIQGGTRRSALMFMLNDWHPDIETFITVKQDFSKINRANLSICISDSFMNAVEDDLDWNLEFPDISYPLYDKEWNGNLDVWKKKKFPVIVYKTIKARYLWNLITESAWRSAEPGIWFQERANKLSNTWYCEDLISTNPCIYENELVSTERGLIPIKDVKIGDIVATHKGRGTVEKVLDQGEKDLVEITTIYNRSILCTPDHRILTDSGWIEAQNLRQGDILILQPHSLLDVNESLNEEDYETGFLAGINFGDGYISKGERKHTTGFTFHPHDLDVANYVRLLLKKYFNVESKINEITQRSGGTVLRVICSRKEIHMFFKQFKYQRIKNISLKSSSFIRGFLQGYFAADGHIETSNGMISICVTSVELNNMIDVSNLLLQLGVYSKIYNVPNKGHVSDSFYGFKRNRKYQYRISIAGADKKVFMDLIGLANFSMKKNYRVTESYNIRRIDTVLSIERKGRGRVYDLVIPGDHSFVVNGVVVHNCSEIGLGPYGVCNLGHINLSKFVLDGEIDFENLHETIKTAVRFLDNVIECEKYVLEENKNYQKSFRKIGLGTLGLADALIKLKIKYGSPECINFLENLYSRIQGYAYISSIELAKEKGCFTSFDRKRYLEGNYIGQLPVHIKEKIKKHGIRNSWLLTQAPTGTGSLLSGASSGIEPNFAFETERSDSTGTYILKHHLAELHSSLPDYFVSASQISPKEHVEVQSVIQKYTCNSISKTINMLNSSSIEDVKRVYELAYELGCKGLTVYRDGSRDTQVLREVKPKGRPDVLQGETYKQSTGCGNIYITITKNEKSLPQEAFLHVSKSGGCVSAFSEAIGRLISTALRAGVSSDVIKEQLSYIRCPLPILGGATSCPDAIARALKGDSFIEDKKEGTTEIRHHSYKSECPECGFKLVFREGCISCLSCSYTQCS